MKLPSPVTALLLLVCIARSAEPALIPQKPPELVALVAAYERTLQPLQEKLQQQVKARAQKYAADLEPLEAQVAGSGQGDALQAVRAERIAYAEGRGSYGYDPAEKRIPAAARELRRLYERDVTKLRADAVPAAKPFAASFVQKLTDLEKKFIAARDADGVLSTQALKREMQDALNDPLYGGNEIVVGDWKGMKFHADGFLTTSGVAKGKWHWLNRSKRTLQVDFQPSWAKDIVFTLTPDSLGMIGNDTTGAVRMISRSK